jgi:two-component system phosphate regulon sensor histidine kinase PhoR
VKADFRDEDVVPLIVQFIKSTPHLFEEGTIEFESDVESFFMPLDIAMFEMVLMNLSVNGFIYNKSEKKKITIKLFVQKNDLILKFIDNGMGIKKSEQKKIFKKFYQIGKTTKGSGLGLYIVQSIVKLHHGDISVESEGENKGSIFTLHFKGVKK